MKLICQSAPGEDGDSIPSGEEKNMLRYYYYLRYGIDTIHVAPLDNKIILRLVSNIRDRHDRVYVNTRKFIIYYLTILAFIALQRA